MHLEVHAHLDISRVHWNLSAAKHTVFVYGRHKVRVINIILLRRNVGYEMLYDILDRIGRKINTAMKVFTLQ